MERKDEWCDFGSSAAIGGIGLHSPDPLGSGRCTHFERSGVRAWLVGICVRLTPRPSGPDSRYELGRGLLKIFPESSWREPSVWRSRSAEIRLVAASGKVTSSLPTVSHSRQENGLVVECRSRQRLFQPLPHLTSTCLVSGSGTLRA